MGNQTNNSKEKNPGLERGKKEGGERKKEKKGERKELDKILYTTDHWQGEGEMD